MSRSNPRDPATPRRRALLAWYDRNRRELPWRGAGHYYPVLVSEFMLQQTQVATALPYFERFLRRFPTAEALADAPADDVLALWSGLGYYRRARALQASARAIVREHDGALPRDPAALRALPGVGEYTAAALASIVHGDPAAVVDGNVIRVLTRLFAIDAPVERAATRRLLRERAAELLDPRRPGDFNQAIMELGATVCVPRAPRCADCPWGGGCLARQEGRPERYPVKAAARASVEVVRALAVFRRGNAVLLVRRGEPGLLDGTWEFPGVDLDPGGDAGGALAAYLSATGFHGARIGAELARARHAITHRRITLRAFSARAAGGARARRGARAWVTGEDAARYPMSSMTAKILRELAEFLTTSGTDGGRARR